MHVACCLKCSSSGSFRVDPLPANKNTQTDEHFGFEMRILTSVANFRPTQKIKGMSSDLIAGI